MPKKNKHGLFTDIQKINYVEILLVTRINKYCCERTDHSKCLICECDIQENQGSIPPVELNKEQYKI